MKLPHKILAVLTALVVLTTAGLAQNLAGVWRGKIKIDMSAMPKNLTPEQRKGLETGLAMAKKMIITLTLRANKTYTAAVTGMPQMGPQSGKNASEGTWKIQGKTLWLTSLKENGKPAKSKGPQQFTIANDSKSFWLNSPARGGMGAGSKLLFVRS